MIDKTLFNSLIGINTNVLIKYFLENNIVNSSILKRRKSHARGTVVENAIALLLNESFPSSLKGPDFSIGEIKTIKIKYLKNGEMRTKGDTPISILDYSEREFRKSNIYKKLERVLCVLIHDDVIVDIKYFEAKNHLKQLESDYNNLFLGKLNRDRKDFWRKSEGRNNKILVRKDYDKDPSNVMVLGNNMIDLSESIVETPNLIIDDQYGYIDSIFCSKRSKLSGYKKTKKSNKKEEFKSETTDKLDILLNDVNFIKQYIIELERKNKELEKKLLSK